MRQILLIILLIGFLTNINSQEKQKILNSEKSKIEKVATSIDSKVQKIEFTLSKNLEDKITEKLESKERTPMDKYGVVIVAIVALIGTLITTLIGTRRSRINLENQLKVSENNLSQQIQANRDLEREKKIIEREHNKINDLKEMVAQFIKLATLLNLQLNRMIYYYLEEGRDNDAFEEYKNTSQLRNELKGVYYSVKVTLDGSEKQRELERVLDGYMNLVDFNIDLKKLESNMYEQPIGQLYHKIKSIIHDNYIEPK
ncbi:MAG: hypothetical protein WCL51_15170 [Bacteroidota bacterium]